jgi:CheY-like chemotaxis protein/HPt (histidine-containing phosphotransfer) domain-containing protein
MIASIGHRGDAKRFEEIGFAGYLVKPIRENQLRHTISIILGQNENSSTPPKIVTRHIGAEYCQKRVLVAEDNATNQLVATKMLEKLGCRCDVAANGREAITALQAIPYDLILMDCQMPEMDGFEATRRIRKGDAGSERASTPVIAMTAWAMQGDREKCLEAGMDDYVPKPVDFPDLRKVLERWFTRKPMEVAGNNTTCEESVAADYSPSVFDKAAFADRLMGNEGAMNKVLAVFLDDTPRLIEVLKEYVGSGDAENAQLQAHSIKGASASIGAEALRAIALEMENAGRERDAAKLEAVMPMMEQGFKQLRQAIETM